MNPPRCGLRLASRSAGTPNVLRWRSDVRRDIAPSRSAPPGGSNQRTGKAGSAVAAGCRFFVAVVLGVVGVLPVRAQMPADAPPIDSACPTANLVDPAFRDAALLTMRQLVVRAPGRSSHGAVRRSLGAAHVDRRGRSWHHVAAYEGNLGLIGALRVDPTLRAEAADWLRWQAAHLPLGGPDKGQLFDHWVLANGAQESVCPVDLPAAKCRQIDAVDSTLASFFLMAQAYLRHGGDAALLREPGLRRAFEVAAQSLAALQRNEGLSWAKPDHAVAYLMDAVEVAAGWRALAELQERVWADGAAAAVSRHLAQRTQDAVERSLWDDPAGLWRVSLQAPPTRLPRWYPDTMAQAWPLLWSPPGRSALAGERARAAWQRAAAAWRSPERDWTARNVDPAGFWWPAAAVAAHCVGDQAAASDWLARARRAWMAAPPPFPWPFQVSDLLWLLWLAEPGPPQAPLPAPLPTPLPTPLPAATSPSSWSAPAASSLLALLAFPLLYPDSRKDLPCQSPLPPARAGAGCRVD